MTDHHLYRAEVHHPGVVSADKKLAQPSFKWSRENGSVAFPIVPDSLKSNMTEITLELETLGRDSRYGLCVNDWVELTSDAIEFSQKVLPLVQVAKIEPSQGRLTLHSSTATDFSGCTMLRRWDQKGEGVNEAGTIDITESADDEFDKWIELESGYRIQFQPGGLYETGQYWLIRFTEDTGRYIARDAKGNDVPLARPIDGVKRHRAALTMVIANVAQECGCTLDPICKGK